MFYIGVNRTTDSALLLRNFFYILECTDTGKVFDGQVGNKLLLLKSLDQLFQVVICFGNSSKIKRQSTGVSKIFVDSQKLYHPISNSAC